MKSSPEIEKEYSAKDIAESIVFPGVKEKKERQAILAEFRNFRKRLSSKQSPKNKTKRS